MHTYFFFICPFKQCIQSEILEVFVNKMHGNQTIPTHNNLPTRAYTRPCVHADLTLFLYFFLVWSFVNIIHCKEN